jgi:hypothetical protein
MYTEKFAHMAIVPKSAASVTAEVLSAAGAVYCLYAVMKSCKVVRFMFQVSVTVAADTTAPAVIVKKRVTPGSDTNAETLATITIPDGTVAGKVMYKDIDGTRLEVGDELVFEHTVQAVDGSSAAGAGWYGIELIDSPESVGNSSNMVLSA